MDYGIFNVRTEIKACDCTRGFTDTVSESALKDDSGGKSPCHTRESNLQWPSAGSMLYRLSSIPTDCGSVKTHIFIQPQHSESRGPQRPTTDIVYFTLKVHFSPKNQTKIHSSQILHFQPKNNLILWKVCVCGIYILIIRCLFQTLQEVNGGQI